MFRLQFKFTYIRIYSKYIYSKQLKRFGWCILSYMQHLVSKVKNISTNIEQVAGVR